ncbi:MAG: hypothetical protein JXA58_02775 [Dehalococcoidia bacterium]|nr:hypothetical protein [Dehalococcoidia bacterium]
MAALLATVALPLFVVLSRPAYSVSEYVFEAGLDERLGTSTNHQLTYFAATALSPGAPADEMVLSFDEGYTRGWVPSNLEVGDTLWVEGSLMTPEVCFGEQYIFYGPPQLYLRQIKTEALWPDQVTELRVLYLSPLSTLVAPIQLPLLFRSDSLSARIVTVLGLRCVLIAATLTFLIRRHSNRAGIILTLALYALIAVVLTMPILGELY